MNRKHLANVRVKQRNQVHIQGLTTKMANEDVSKGSKSTVTRTRSETVPSQTLAQLRSNELFTQYGKIMKMFMSRRSGSTNLHTPDARFQHVNLYINYSKNSEAVACIGGLDGTTLPDGHRVKASLGSTKYCPSFLRGVKCHNDNCTGAHEMAEEVDGNGATAREEMSTACVATSRSIDRARTPLMSIGATARSRHAQKESEHRVFGRSNSSASQASSSALPAALPASASWANRATGTSGPSGSQPSSPGISTTSLPGSGSFPLELSRNAPPATAAAKTTHPLPPKPRQASFSSSGPSSVPPSLPSIPTASAALPPPPVTAPVSKPPELPAASSAASEPLKTTEAAPATSAVAAPSLNATSEPPYLPPALPAAPPGIAPPPGLGGPPASSPAAITPSLPPGLGLPASSLPPDAPPPSRTPSLPPGLFSDVDPHLDGISSPGSFAFNLGLLGQDEKGKQKEIIPDPEHLVSFASTLGLSTLSLTDPISIEPTSAGLISRSSSLTGSAFLPLSSNQYHGSFDPFADTDGRGGDMGGTPPPPDETRGRGSRFGFAKRDSASGFSFGDSPVGSALRSSLHGPPGLERTDSNRPSSAVPEAISRFASPAVGKPPESGSSTPDASVLFPGVNLAASYSANAMPAALAARGLKSPPGSRQTTASSFSSAGSTPDSAPLGYPGARLPTPGFHPSMRTASPVSAGGYMGLGPNGTGVDMAGGGYGMASGYQDPAILNMRMAPNGTPYGPSGLGGPTEINGYNHYSVPNANAFAGMPRAPYAQDHLAGQQQYGLQHHPGIGRQQSYFGNAAAVGAGLANLQRGEQPFSWLVSRREV